MRNILIGTAYSVAGLAVLAVLGALFVGSSYLFSDPSGKIRITEPRDGAVVESETVVIRGTSSPDWAGVYRVMGNGGKEPIVVDEDGRWAYLASLQEGENTFRFHLGSAYGQSLSVTVEYRPRR